MTSLSLSSKDLIDLTGYCNKSKQVDWLSSHGWTFVLNRFNAPIVSRAFYDLQMGSLKNIDQASTQPNWSAIA
jgi:hypothetical protein